jgi:hypothetical protein
MFSSNLPLDLPSGMQIDLHVKIHAEVTTYFYRSCCGDEFAKQQYLDGTRNCNSGRSTNLMHNNRGLSNRTVFAAIYTHT